MNLSAQEIEYSLTGNKTYEIADIQVEGADSYEDFVLIGFSGLAVGDKVEVPGPQITKAIRRFWKQGLFSNVQIKADRIEGNKIWLVIVLEQRPRISEVRYDGLKKSEREDIEVKAGIRQGSQMTPNLEDHAKTVIATGIRGQDLVNYIQRSKIILNLHAFDGVMRQEQVRMFTPVINNCCVVSEKSERNEFGMSIIETDSKNINVTLKTLIKTGNWASYAAAAGENYKIFCSGRNY